MMKNEYRQSTWVTCSSSGASRLLALLIMFDDDDDDNGCAGGGGGDGSASWHPYPCAPEGIYIYMYRVDQGDIKNVVHTC